MLKYLLFGFGYAGLGLPLKDLDFIGGCNRFKLRKLIARQKGKSEGEQLLH
jgi:hypothetical protein